MLEAEGVDADVEAEAAFAALAAVKGDDVFEGPSVADVVADAVGLLVEALRAGVVAEVDQAFEDLVEAVRAAEEVVVEMAAEEVAGELNGPEVAVAEGDAGVEFLEGEILRREALIDAELEPAGGHDGELAVDGGNFSFSGGSVEAEIVGDVEDDEIARTVDRVAGLERVVEAEADRVGAAELVDVANGAEAERLEVGDEVAAVDRWDVARAFFGFGDVAIGKARGDEVAKAVDFPAGVLVVVNGVGTHFGVEAELAERAGVVVARTVEIGVVRDATTGDRGESEPGRGADRMRERVIGVEAVGAELGARRGVERAERERVFAEGGEAGVEALRETGFADGSGDEIKAELGEALLDDLEGVGLKAGEEGNVVVVAGVNGFDEVVGLLDLEELGGAEIAEDLGIAPVVDLGGEGEAWVDLLDVIPFGEAAAARDPATDDVGVARAVIGDETGVEIAAVERVGVVGRVARVGAGRAHHDAAVGVEAEVAAEEECGRNGKLETRFGVEAERAAIAAVDLGVGEEEAAEVAGEGGEGEWADVADAGGGALGADAVVGSECNAVGFGGGDERGGFGDGDASVVDGEGGTVAGGAGAGDVDRMFADAKIADFVGAGIFVVSDGVGEEATRALGENGVAARGDDAGFGVEAKFVGGEADVAVVDARIIGEDGFAGADGRLGTAGDDRGGVGRGGEGGGAEAEEGEQASGHVGREERRGVAG